MPERRETPLKILMTADAAGGVWQYSVDLIAGLAPRGAKVLLATMGPRPSGAQRQQLRATPDVTLTESDFALEWMPSPWKDVDAAGEWLLDLSHSFRPDVVHLHSYSHANLAWGKPVMVTAHSCVFSWWRAVRGETPDKEWMEYKRRVTAGLASADAVTAPSAYMSSALQNEYGVPGEKIRVIHNFSRIERTARVPKQPFLLAAGRLWDPAKNLRLVEQIASKLKWEMRIAGAGRETAPHTAEQSVQYLGSLPHSQLIEAMRGASIFLHGALYEPFGLAVLEAASSRCCLILSDIPSLRELWAGAALFLDPRDPERWTFEVNKLIADPGKQRDFGERAHSQAKKYRANAAVNKYWMLYRSLVKSKTSERKGVAA